MSHDDPGLFSVANETPLDDVDSYIEHLPLPDVLKATLRRRVQEALGYQRARMEHSKEEAMRALQQGYLGRIRDLQELVKTGQAVSVTLAELVEELCKKNETEPKTKLLSFEAFLEKFRNLLSLDRRSGDQCCAFGIIDVAKFKYINDTFGHLVGDKILIRVAALLREHVRGGDLLSRERRTEARRDLHARMGGDEFIFYAPRIEGCEMVCEVAQRFVGAVHNFDWSREDEQLDKIEVSVDVGVVCFNPSVLLSDETMFGTFPSKLIEAADKAMYKAKKKAKGRVRQRVSAGVTASDGAAADDARKWILCNRDRHLGELR